MQINCKKKNRRKKKAKVKTLPGQRLLLFSIVKSLFNHILEVTKDIPSFHSEYSSILRSILIVRDYRYQMKNKTYSSEFDIPFSIPCLS